MYVHVLQYMYFSTCTVYRKIFSPHFIFPPFALVIWQILDWANSNVSKHFKNSRQGKTVCMCWRAKNYTGETNKVYCIFVTDKQLLLYCNSCFPFLYVHVWCRQNINFLWKEDFFWCLHLEYWGYQRISIDFINICYSK